jgi:hypothetical protein
MPEAGSEAELARCRRLDQAFANNGYRSLGGPARCRHGIRILERSPARDQIILTAWQDYGSAVTRPNDPDGHESGSLRPCDIPEGVYGKPQRRGEPRRVAERETLGRVGAMRST